MAKIIIFGLKDFASLAHFYLKHDSSHEIAAFSAHSEFLTGIQTFEGLPLVAFEDVEKELPPRGYKFFVPMSYRKMNRMRAQIYEDVKAKGYEMISYIHSSTQVASGTKIGENCFILENNVIQPFVQIGNDVMIWSGNQISHHSVIKDHVFIASNITLSGHCTVGAYSFLGLSSSVKERIMIAEGSLIGMNATVIKDTEKWSIYKGTPANRDPQSSQDFEI